MTCFALKKSAQNISGEHFGGTGWFPLNHGNVLGKGFPPKSRELTGSPGIPGEFPGNMQRRPIVVIQNFVHELY